MFIFKIPGPMAEAGKNLDTIEVVTKEVYAGQGYLGSVASDILGVHGKAGVGSVFFCSAREAVKQLLGHMTTLGGTSKLEDLVVTGASLGIKERRM